MPVRSFIGRDNRGPLEAFPWESDRVAAIDPGMDERTKSEAVLCPIKTNAGDPCHQVPCEDFPCCYNHIGHWAGLSRSNLMSVIEARAGRFGLAHPHGGGWVAGLGRDRGCADVVIRVTKRPGEQLTYTGDSFSFHGVDLRMSVEDASVVADKMREQGDHDAADALLDAAKEAPARRREYLDELSSMNLD